MNFPFAEHWHIYIFFSLMILALTWVDLSQSKKRTNPLLWSLIWVALGLSVGVAVYQYSLFHAQKLLSADAASALAYQHALEYYAGYIVEKSLAVDNIFIFLLIFSSLKISPDKQHRVLFLGILGALIFRAIFIALGAALMQYQWVIWIFGVFIFLSGLKLLFTHENAQSPEKWMKRLAYFLPIHYENSSDRFFVKIDGKWFATPLLAALLIIEISDVIFALDSVPAIFALTKEPLIVFTSNICAVMGLRSMYFLLSDFLSRFHLLRYGLAATLLFIGLKMFWLNPVFDGHFPITWSLGIICFCLTSSIVASSIFPPSEKSR